MLVSVVRAAAAYRVRPARREIAAMRDSRESADPLAIWARQALEAQTVALDLSARLGLRVL